MQVSCRLTRWLIAVMVLLGLMLSQPNASALDLDAYFGFGFPGTPGAMLSDEWVPLTVFINGSSSAGAGIMRVTVNIGGYTTRYTRNVSLSEQQNNEPVRFILPLFREDNNRLGTQMGIVNKLKIELIRDGRLLSEQAFDIPSRIYTTRYQILYLSRDSGGLSFLSQKSLGLFHKNLEPSSEEEYAPPPQISQQKKPKSNKSKKNSKQSKKTYSKPPTVNPFQQGKSLERVPVVSYCSPVVLPELVQGYEMMDAIIISDLPPSSLTEEQQRALKNWVCSGGLLVLSGGDLNRLSPGFFQDLLPMKLDPTVANDSLQGLQTRFHHKLTLTQPMPVLTGKLNPNAITLLAQDGKMPVKAGEGGLPLIVSMPYGNGQVVLTTFDISAPEVRGWDGAPSLWQDILSSGNNSLSPSSLLERNTNTNAIDLHGLANALSSEQVNSTPQFQVLSIFLGSYLFLLIPVNYLLLKRLDRRELAWITSPILIIGFSLAAYVMGSSVKGSHISLDRVTVIEGQPGTNVASGFSVMSLYSPARTSYDLDFGNPKDPANPAHGFLPTEARWGSEEVDRLDVHYDRSPKISDATVRLWATRSFQIPMSVELGGPVSVTCVPSEPGNPTGKWNITVQNKSRYTLKQCRIVGSNDTHLLGDLPPGKSMTEDEVTLSQQTVHSIQLSSLNSAMADWNPTASANHQQALRTGLLSALSQSRVDDYQSTVLPSGIEAGFVTAWIEDPLLDVQVNGKTPESRQANLLLLHLPATLQRLSAVSMSSIPFSMPPGQDPLTIEPLNGYQTGAH